jgi:putative phosphoribosyl transferase
MPGAGSLPPSGREVARALAAPLDLVFVRKIRAPNHPEFGIGALVDGTKPEVVLNDAAVEALRVPEGYLKAEIEHQLREAARRRRIYTLGCEPVPIEGRTAIVVDDGIATGGTVTAALKAVRRARPARLVLAVPVAPREAIEELRPQADEIVCLMTPEPFIAVGQHYRLFDQTTDDEVVAIMRRAGQRQEANHG